MLQQSETQAQSSTTAIDSNLTSPVLTNSEALFDTFETFDTNTWAKKNGIWDGPMMLSYLDERCIHVESTRGTLVLECFYEPMTFRKPEGTEHLVNFAAPGFKSNNSYGYGCYEVRIKLGISTAPCRLVYEFFLYGTGDAPGIGQTTNKIDIILATTGYGSRIQFKTKVYSRRTPPQDYHVTYPAHDLESAFHTFGIKWTPNTVYFSFDGAIQNTVDIRSMHEFVLPLYIWQGMYGTRWDPAESSHDNSFDASKCCHLKTQTEIDWIKFTPGEDCNLGQEGVQYSAGES